MNKVILIALIAVCVASSGQAFVKRDAPVAAPAAQENYLAKIDEALKQIGEPFKQAFNPEEVQKQFNEVIETMKKGIDDLKNRMEKNTAETKA